MRRERFTWWTAVLVAVATSASVSLLPTDGAANAASPVRCYPSSDFPPLLSTLRGDVDGDGSPDVVRTRARWADADSCRAWLSVRTADRVLKVEIAALDAPLIAPPGLAGLIRLDRRPGLEIAVVTWLGASTGFLEIDGLRGHGLVHLSSELFAYGGSVMELSGVDCARGHGTALVSSIASYGGDNRYHVVRHFYALRGGTLLLVSRLTERYRVRPVGLQRFPEIVAGLPFPTCTVVAGSA